MTRKEAQEWLISYYKKQIAEKGGDSVWLRSPGIGKCEWTLDEMLESVTNDTPLEGSRTNTIDDLLALERWYRERGLEFELEEI